MACFTNGLIYKILLTENNVCGYIKKSKNIGDSLLLLLLL